MQAVSAASRGKAEIAGNYKQNAAPSAQRGKRCGPGGSRRVVVIAVDNRRAGRQDTDDQFRAGDAAPVGQERERKRRRGAACAFEGLRRRC